MFTSSRELDNLLLFSAHEPQIVPLSLSLSLTRTRVDHAAPGPIAV